MVKLKHAYVNHISQQTSAGGVPVCWICREPLNTEHHVKVADDVKVKLWIECAPEDLITGCLLMFDIVMKGNGWVGPNPEWKVGTEALRIHRHILTGIGVDPQNISDVIVGCRAIRTQHPFPPYRLEMWDKSEHVGSLDITTDADITHAR